MRIDYYPAVASELEEIRNHYEQCSTGFEVDFIDEFERQVLTIAAMPSRWMVVERDIRRALMKRFPYVIFFRIVGDARIRVTVLKHEKRHPAFGLARA